MFENFAVLGSDGGQPATFLEYNIADTLKGVLSNLPTLRNI